MTVPAEDDVRCMTRLQEIQHDRGVGEHDRVTAWDSMRDAIHIRTVSRRIVESHDTQLTLGKRNDDGLVDQEMQFVAIGKLEKLRDRDAAVMIMIAKRHVHRRETSEMTEKLEQMR